MSAWIIPLILYFASAEAKPIARSAKQVAAPSMPASDCSTVRMDQPGQAFAKIPTYLQWDYSKHKDSRFCYAATAAQLIDSERFAEGDHELKQLTSPFSVATNYMAFLRRAYVPLPPGANETDSLLALGDAAVAINVSRQRPVCDENFMKAFDHTADAGISPSDPNRRNFAGPVKFLRAVMYDMDKIKRGMAATDEFGRRVDETMRTEDAFPDTNATAVLGGYWSCMAHQGSIDGPTLMQALRAASTQPNRQSALSTFMDTFCRDHQFQPKVPVAHKVPRQYPGSAFDPHPREENEAQLRNRINKMLGGKTPRALGMSYCANVTTDPSYGGYNDAVSSEMPKDCESHASVIIGRQFNRETGHCDYLVRDSIGGICKDGKGNDITKWPCTEKGDYLIDSDTLLHSIQALQWMDPDQS